MNRQLVLRCKWCGARQGVDFHQAVYHPDTSHYANLESVVDMTPYLTSSHAWYLRRRPPAEPDGPEYCEGPHPDVVRLEQAMSAHFDAVMEAHYGENTLQRIAARVF